MRAVLSVVVSLLLSMNMATAEPSGTFRHAHTLGFGSLSSLDPISKGRVLQITEKIMNRLVRPGLDGKPQPDLATEWSVTDDAMYWTFKLRQDVRFHDGSAFDADDVVYTFDRILDPEMDSPVRSVISMIKGVEALDPMTVRLTLKHGYADLPLQLMDARLRIIPEGSGDTIGQTGIGTGPFKVQKFDADGITYLTANTDYWEGPPKLDMIEVIGIPDAQARLTAFLSGQLDMERGIDPSLRRVLQNSGDYNVQDIPTGNWIGMVFRTDVAPYDDVRVRRAIRLAVDRADLLKLAVGGNGIVSCDTPVGPNDQYRADLDCPQDIEKARALLAEAGYPDGLEIEVNIATLEPSWPSMAVALQEQLAPAGIRVKIVKVANDGYWSQVWMQKDAVGTAWGERPADQALNEIFRSTAKWNESYFKDPTFDAMLDIASQELDFYKRRALYQGAQEYLFENSGTLIPYHITQLVGLSPRVHDLDAVKNDAVRWHLVRIED
ncbi:ABC transporter substrate-binding protein [uncultured Roseovarius sp.]|uniref:ABC transporter substrate-binding protein n=1 Tax=uncultured Roseovarius sp. TaxID=293344 RepID=UPI0026303B38|nr:ABC transporter substrate-binding protein [uncultured Roseovarius sp.]